MDKSYWELFFGESEEYISQINQFLVKLEKDPHDVEAINEIFRLMHTLKGMAATMGFGELSEFAHKIEDVFDLLRSGKREVTPKIMDVIFSSIDAFQLMLAQLREKKPSTVEVSDYVKELEEAVSLRSKREAKEEKSASTPSVITFTPEESAEVVKKRKEGYEIVKLDVFLVSDCPMKEARAFLVLIRVEQMGVIIKSIPSQEELKKGEFDLSFTIIIATKEDKKVIEEELGRVLEVERVVIEPLREDFIKGNSPKTQITYLKRIQSMRIPVERLDKIMNFMGELSIAKSRLLQTLQSKDFASLEETAFIIDRLVSSLQDETLQMRLLPISYILDAFPRVVRDLVRRSNKDVDLKMIGSEIELDRVVLDEIGDPLMHLVRNAVDHGIEDIETRKRLGKPPKGKLTIKVSREKGHVIIEISDDGRGIDFEAIRRKAIEKGLFTEPELVNLDAKQALDIMSMPGFSTSEEITDISGRGVGLDVVKTKLDALGGRIDLETEAGKGTKFILTLPLTLAIIKAMLVKIGSEVFAIPIMNIRESVKAEANLIKTIQNREVITVRDEIIPLLRLDKELGVNYEMKDLNRLSVVIVEGRAKSLGLLVDLILGEQDIVVKPLGSMVRKVKGIAGATILGDGRVALILDVVNIV